MLRLLLISLFSVLEINAQIAIYVISGPNLPATCSTAQGQVWFKTTGGAGVQGLYSCDAPNTWVFHGSGGAGVSSFNSRTGAVLPLVGDYTTSIITEGSNLYFTNARAQAAVSASAPIVDTAGVFSCPTCLTSNAVTSVFTRTGAVVAVPGDYSPESLATTTAIESLHAGLAKANNGTPTSVVFIGDSITRGTGATTTTTSWTANFINTLKQVYGNGGEGFSATINNATPNSGGGSITLVGTWTDIYTFGIGQNDSVATFASTKSANSGATATRIVAAGSDTIDVYCATNTDSGSGLAITIDGISKTAACASTSGSLTMVRASYAGLDPTISHTIVATAPGAGNGYLFGFVGRLSTGGVNMFNAAASGADSASISTAAQINWLDQVPNLAAIFIALGVNETDTTGATLVTNLGPIQTKAAALGVPIIFVLTENNNSNIITSLQPAVKTWANSHSYPWISIADRWGTFANGNTLGLYFDTVHPNNSGHLDFSKAVMLQLRLVSPNPAYYDNTVNNQSYYNIDGISTPLYTDLSFPVLMPHTDLLCAAGNDNSIAKQTITSATLANPAVLTVAATSSYWAGEKVTITGVTQSGWNGNYTVQGNPTSTTITINLNSSALSAISSGTPLVSLTCGNSTDITTDTAFATHKDLPAGFFTVVGKEIDYDLGMSLFSAAIVTGINTTLTWKSGNGTMFTTSSTITQANRSDRTFSWKVAIRSITALSTAMPLQITSLGPFVPGWSFDNMSNQIASVFCCPNVSQSGLANGPSLKFVAVGAGGTFTYVSGLVTTGTGNCLLTATNGTGSNAVTLIAVSSGTPGVISSWSPSLAQTSTGSGYTTLPTNWTATVPTVGGASTCSGTVVTSGGSAVGAQGNAYRLLSFRPYMPY